MDRHQQTNGLSRRTFLTTASAALAGAAMGGLVPQSEAATRHPKRGGVLQFGTFHDTSGLDRTAITSCTPLIRPRHVYRPDDIRSAGPHRPGIAESWEPNKELTSWVFRLRKGVLFHNGREVDAEAVKLNILRIKDPAIGSDWHRGRWKN